MKKITLYLSTMLWRSFRVACLQRGTSASQEITRLMEQQLAQWQKQNTMQEKP